MTKKYYIETLLAMAEVQANPGCVSFLENELRLLSNRKGGEKAKKKMEEQDAIMESIEIFLSANSEKAFTASEIMKNAFTDDISIQRVTAMLKKLVEAEKVTKTTEKKVSYFKIAAGVAEEVEETVVAD